ncbi:MAG: hypothetical protein AAB250_02770, partial [Bdellovibrionota bacterium]
SAAGSIGAGTGNAGQVRFYDLGASGNNFVAFRAPDSIAADVVWSLPAVDGGSGNVLSTNGAGSLSWVAASGGGDFLRDGSLSMTGQFLATVGSSLTPGISFGGDNDSGIYSSGANALAFSTAAQQRMVVNSSGNVGIGTTTPASLLHVAGKTVGAGNVEISDPDGGYLTFSRDDSTTQTDDRLGTIMFGDYDNGSNFDSIVSYASENHTATAAGNHLTFLTVPGGTNTPLERMRIQANGNVGVGTTTPLAGNRFEVVGGAIAAGSQSATLGGEVRFYETGGTNYVALRAPSALAADAAWVLPASDGTNGQVLQTNGAGSLAWTTASSSGGTGDFKADGSVSMTGAFRAIAGSTGTPAITFGDDIDTGFLSAGTNVLAVATGGQERLRIDPSGNVGIGTNSPPYPLSVIRDSGSSVGQHVVASFGQSVPSVTMYDANTDFSTTQGYRNWTYLNGNGSQMTWNAGGYWQGAQTWNRIWAITIHPDDSGPTDSMRRWTAPVDGNAHVTGSMDAAGTL